MTDWRECVDERDVMELALSRSAPKYLPSSLTFLLSFLLLPKKDLAPDDCLVDLLSPDMISGGLWASGFDLQYAMYGSSWEAQC